MPGSEASHERIRAGDAAAFSSLVDRHYRTIWALSYSRLGDWSAAEDVAQEAFLVAFSNYSRLREPRLFASWLRKIARHLYYLEGRSAAEAARALGVTENSIRTRLYQGRRRMREDLETRVEEELRRPAPRNGTRQIRRVLALGPAVPAVGARAATAGFGLWAHALRYEGGGTFLPSTVRRALSVTGATRCVFGVLAAATLLGVSVYVGMRPSRSGFERTETTSLPETGSAPVAGGAKSLESPKPVPSSSAPNTEDAPPTGRDADSAPPATPHGYHFLRASRRPAFGSS